MSWVSRLSRVLLIGILAFGWATPPAGAVPPRDKLADTLGDFWSEVLALPADVNPFTGGDGCVLFEASPGRQLLTPLAPAGDVDPLECTVKPGTAIFVTGWTSECSNHESDPFFGSDEPSLRTCARDADAGLTAIDLTVDGVPVALTEVETDLLDVVLPAGNIFGQPPGTHLLSVGHGWVTLLHPLRPGCHEITIHFAGNWPTEEGSAVDDSTTTTLIVGSHTDCDTTTG